MHNEYINDSKFPIRQHHWISPGHVLALIIAVLNTTIVFSQVQSPIFRHINSRSHGLSQNHGLCIIKDHKGFMWFGTQDGLNKYDGYSITVYKNDSKDSMSLSNNFINSIFEDKKKNLWVGTRHGLNRFDRTNNKFYKYIHNPKDKQSISNNIIASIFEDRNGYLWIGTECGLNRFDPVSEKFTQYLHDENNLGSLGSNEIKLVYEDRNGRLWITTGGGLNLFNPAEKSFKKYEYDPNDPGSLGNHGVSIMLEDSKGNFWIGTEEGLNLFDRDKGIVIKRYSHDPKDPRSLGDNAIYCMLEDHLGNIWIGVMNNGLNLFNPQEQNFTRYVHDEINDNSISNNTPCALYEDETGTMWVGVHRGGINYFNIAKEKFKTFQRNESITSLSNNNITSFCHDENNIWIGTDGGGLNLFNPQTNEFTRYRHDIHNPKSLASDVILTIYKDSNKNLWIGTLNTGLVRYDQPTNTFIHYKRFNTKDYHVYSITEDANKNLWFGTSGGVCTLDKKTNTLIPFKISTGLIDFDFILYMLTDSKNRIWLGSFRNGLWLYDDRIHNFRKINLEQNTNHTVERINAIHEDKKGNLWIGTIEGLILYNHTTKAFKLFKEKDGLSSNVIRAITEDNAGNIWISSLMGISKFDPKLNIFTNYTELDGLQGNEFTMKAFLKGKDGQIYFGGINGFNSFLPENIHSNGDIPPVYITNFKIFNRPVPIGKDSPLPRHINEVDTITLSYKEEVFTFEFAALNYMLPEKNQYAYKLEGFDGDWNYIGNKRSATYTRLEPGTYTFKVKASNNDGLWNEQGTSIELVITPPFWLTWWFKTLTALFIVGSLLTIYKIRVGAIKLQREELQHQVDERTKQLQVSTKVAEKARKEAEQANRAKSIFLATMSHEIRTPMNGVLGMASLLSETTLTAEQQEYANTIKISGESLLGVINDILDFSKIESGKMELDINDFNLRDCIEEVLDMFAPKASHSELDLIYEIDYNVPSQIRGDSLRLRQILINLIGNAVKFTQHGEIFIKVKLLQNQGNNLELLFEVRDTGIGIPHDKLQRLFKAFSQVDSSTTRKYGGTGLGLAIAEKLIALMGGAVAVESTVGVGTTFKFTIHTTISQKSTKTYVYQNIAAVEGNKILVIDDNETNRIILKNQLLQWKLVPTLASNGREALTILSDPTVHVDLIITDMHMPGMDGILLAQQIRLSRPRVPIMLLSSIGDERSQLHKDLFCSVLSKPVKQRLLHSHIITQLLHLDQTLHTDKIARSVLHNDMAKQYPLHILIAEDNPVNQRLAETVLMKLGYKPAIAANGKLAMDLFKLHEYDLIFMDVQMPEMDGLEATQFIRLLPQSQPIIIAMTANAMQGDREICLQAGMNDYISKPIKLDDLVKLIEKWAKQIKKSV
jgi:signal transduction histidine kinase/ligand-binding sensor domain-containing protein/CheY-like chemotaxis protein